MLMPVFFAALCRQQSDKSDLICSMPHQNYLPHRPRYPSVFAQLHVRSTDVTARTKRKLPFLDL